MKEQDKTRPMNDIEAVNQHKRIKFKLFLFSVMRSALYWGICTSLMIWMDNKGMVIDNLLCLVDCSTYDGYLC